MCSVINGFADFYCCSGFVFDVSFFPNRINIERELPTFYIFTPHFQVQNASAALYLLLIIRLLQQLTLLALIFVEGLKTKTTKNEFLPNSEKSHEHFSQFM